LSANGIAAGRVADAVANSVVQNVATVLLKQGHKGGLGDSRALRGDIRDQVSAILLETGMHDIEKRSALMAATTVCERQVYSVQEFCSAYVVSRKTLYDLWKLGAGPASYRSGGRVVLAVAPPRRGKEH
jgi:hypothetical protein